MPQPGRFCARCAQAFIPKQWSKKPRKYCSRSCADSPYWIDENGYSRLYGWNDPNYRNPDFGCPQDFKAEPEELMTDEEYRVFLESDETIIPERLRDYDDMISPVLDLPQADA